MPSFVATLTISPRFREEHFQALQPGGRLSAEIDQWAEAHLKYVRDLKAQGKLLVAGPTVAFTWALILVKAGNLEEARALIEEDPGVKHGLFTDFKLEPWYHMA